IRAAKHGGIRTEGSQADGAIITSQSGGTGLRVDPQHPIGAQAQHGACSRLALQGSSWGSRGGSDDLKVLQASRSHYPPTEACTLNTLSATAPTSSILAIDLGKYKGVARVHDSDSDETRFTTFDTTRAELQWLLAKEQPDLVIIETCLLAGWVH